MSTTMRWAALVGTIVLVLVIGNAIYWYLDTERQEDVIETPIETVAPASTVQTIGASVQGRAIQAHVFGDGPTHLLFVGGVHGGYEWNSTMLAYEFIDYFTESPDSVPEGMRITIVPSANPDGLYTVIGKEGRFALSDVPNTDHSEGRFNANGVDLNRNFDCKWQPESVWRERVVSAGSRPFSEPEAQALRALISETKPDAVIFWHSQASAVYASECEDGVLPQTTALMNTYAGAAGYKAVESFSSYSVTGDSEGWLASIGIPAITVEMSTHDDIEWGKNLAGTRAVIDYYALR